MRLRSGVAKAPKFPQWASPESWTAIPVTGVSARSKAISPAVPRKNMNDEVAIR